MLKEELLSEIQKVEKIAAASKFRRMMIKPSSYIYAILFRELVYRLNRKEKEVVCETFFNAAMNILLPSSTDIYITGGKSHSSEIRLAKFLINHLKQHDVFIDVGAHYGYFSLLASKLVGLRGKVVAFEASPKTFSILEKNKSNTKNIEAHNLAVSDTDAELTFYEFPNLYAEYNSLDISQFENEEWFKQYEPEEINVKPVILDEFFVSKNLNPTIIKIDVEGAEFKVLNGSKLCLLNNSPIIIMEYLSDERGNKAHVQAENLLKSLGYKTYSIDNSGRLESIENAIIYLKYVDLESDNIVFMKDQRNGKLIGT